MVYVYQAAGSGADPLGEWPSEAAAVADLREWWMEEPEGPQCFYVESDAGEQLAVLLRDRDDAQVCHTLYADGHVEHHRCRYILANGRYVATHVVELDPEEFQRWGIAGSVGVVEEPLPAA